MTIYISIPMTGKDFEMQKLIAWVWQKLFTNLGYEVENPFFLSEVLNSQHKRAGLSAPTYDEYLAYDLKILEDCTHIFLCKGWTESKGCMAEVDRAIELGLTFITQRNISLS